MRARSPSVPRAEEAYDCAVYRLACQCGWPRSFRCPGSDKNLWNDLANLFAANGSRPSGVIASIDVPSFRNVRPAGSMCAERITMRGAGAGRTLQAARPVRNTARIATATKGRPRRHSGRATMAVGSDLPVRVCQNGRRFCSAQTAHCRARRLRYRRGLDVSWYARNVSVHRTS
jgi:hypothetical protein